MEQLATQVANQAQGNSPSTSEAKGKEQCKAISLRSGKNYDGPDVVQPFNEEVIDQSAPTPTLIEKKAHYYKRRNLRRSQKRFFLEPSLKKLSEC